MPKARRPRHKAHTARVDPLALNRPVTFGPNVQPPPSFVLLNQGLNAPAQPGAAGGGPQTAAPIIQSVSFLHLPREVRLMIYEYCDPDLIPCYKWLHVRLSPPQKPGEKRWWICDICGKEGKDCYCLRPVLYKIHPALLDEVHDFVLRKNGIHLEPAAWFDLAWLHDPGRRRPMRAPTELQALWTQFMAGLRRVGVSMQWDPAYLAAVHKALSQSAPQLRELTLFIPKARRSNAEWAAYAYFLERLSEIRTLDVVRIVSRHRGDRVGLPRAAQLVGCRVERVCYRCGLEMPLAGGPCFNHWRQIIRTSPSSYLKEMELDDGNVVWKGELTMLGCYVKIYRGYDLSKYIP